MQNCIKFQYFLDFWKIAQIISIKKPMKDYSLPTNYRLISILSILSKIFETIILNRIKHHLNTNNILIPEQFGFKTKHNTTLQPARVTDPILINRNNYKITSLLMLGIEKAFDSVWHNGIISKLLKIKMHHYLIKLINSFLDKRTFSNVTKLL